MDNNFSKRLTSPIKPSFKDAGGNNENEMNPVMALKLKGVNSTKKNIAGKNFMSPTISAANKRILMERNESSDVVEQYRVVWPSSFGSRFVISPVEINQGMALKLKGVNSTKKNIAGKNFMSPTTSTANKKILLERNESSDVLEENSVVWSSSFDSKSPVVGDVHGEAGLKVYDPVKNYLSPRPKYLRHNPNRRRKILKENDEGSVRDSTNSSINAGCGLGLGVGSLGTTDSSSQKESVERVENVIDKEDEVDDDEGDESEEDEEKVIEYEEDRFWSLKGLLKWSLVVIALVLMTQGICSVNSPTDSDNLKTVGDFSDWSFVNRAAGLNFSEAEESINIVMGFKDRGYVYGAASVDYSKIGTGPVRDADLEARRFEKVVVNHDYEGLNMVETVKELVEGENGLIDDVVVETVEGLVEVENRLIDDAVAETVEESVEVDNGLIDDAVHHDVLHDETDIIADEMSSKEEDTDHSQPIKTLSEQNIAESEVLEIVDVNFSQDVVNEQLGEAVNDETDLVQDDMWSTQEDADHMRPIEVMETDDVEVKKEVSVLLTANLNQDGFGEDMNVAEKVIGDTKTTELASSDPAVIVLTGFVVLLLTSIGVIYHSKRTKSTPPVTTPVQKEDLKEAEPSTNPSSLVKSAASLAEPKEDVSKEISHINAPSAELLGEFVFGEEVTSSVRSYMSPEANASNSLIQTTVSFSSRTNTARRPVNFSTGDSHTARKPRHKAAESSSMTRSSVRRSSRIQSRSVNACNFCK